MVDAARRPRKSTSSHAVLDPDSRRRKARKIAAVVATARPLADASLLDIGTGSGHIAHELARVVGHVTSIDVVDEREEHEGYDHVLLTGDRLPFDDGAFDIIVSNHVIEHTRDQAVHVQEILRLLKPGGICYLATPNKYWLTDPHYRLPFISWLPRPWATRYLWWLKRATWDIYPLSQADISGLFASAKVTNALPILVRGEASASLDVGSGIVRLLRRFPDSVLDLTRHFSPTLLFLIEKAP